MVSELQDLSKNTIKVKVIVADLSKVGASQSLFDNVAAALKEEGGHVDYLLNNAGFAQNVLFDQHDPASKKPCTATYPQVPAFS